MAYNFEVDSTKVEELATKMDEWANKLQEEFDTIYSLIGDLQNVWDGNSYQTFKVRCDEFRPAMDTIVTTYKAYGLLFKSNVIDADTTLEEELNTLFSNIS